MPEPAAIGERVYRGIPVSAGVCRGRIVVLGHKNEVVPVYSVSEADLAKQADRLEQALAQTRQEILEIQNKVCKAMGAQDASIFDAHLLVMEDRTLIDEVVRVIQEQRVNAEYAFQQVAEKYAATLGAIADDYLRERAADMRDVTARILNNLIGRKHDSDLRNLKEPCIIVSTDLTPSTTAQFDKKMVLGFATDTGSRTSHTAIMARSLRIPAVVGLHNATQHLATGQYALLDGYNGLIIVNPTDQTLFEYGQLVRKQVDLKEKLRETREQPAVSLDGVSVMLAANLEQAGDSAAVIESGAQGVGLFRTEYLFLNQSSLPTEDEQYEAYRQVAAALKPHPVVIRTLDSGGDKFLANVNATAEMNPALGWRAIRVCLQEREMFRTQLRAILRASVEGNVKLMYPMISGLEELNQANALLDESKQELRARDVPFDDAMEVGIMIEIPSAAMIADALAKRVKFFSLGTNDLIQYSLAVDRLNERIGHLYEPTHPGVLRLIKTVIDAAHRHGIWAGVCGEMASDPTLVPLLLGLGADELSVSPPLVPAVKFLIRRLKLTEARELAEFALECESGGEILTRAQTLARGIAPSLFESK